MMRKPTDYPEILADLAQRVVAHLIKGGVDQAQAGAISREVVEEIRHHWGGQLVYIPQGLSFEKRQEYEKIWKAFDGHNHDKLAREFKRSVSQIYRIVEIMRVEEMRKRQHDMFSTDGTDAEAA